MRPLTDSNDLAENMFKAHSPSLMPLEGLAPPEIQDLLCDVLNVDSVPKEVSAADRELLGC